jgi:RimJ/RimL family protein N-acetyltransferase
MRLRSKRLEDVVQDYQWRQDPELSQLDASEPLDEPFEEYQRGYIWELEHPAHHRRRFAIETVSGLHIGNIAYFDIEEGTREAQMGIMIGDRAYWSRGYGMEAIQLLLGHVFGQNGLESVYLRTLEWNIRAQRCFSKCGFIPVGRLKEGFHDFLMMRVTRTDWERMARKQREEAAVQTISERSGAEVNPVELA